ncbi:MAG TPA: amino acid adenylation domain-containing protein, partial [Pyrinomonadaceae bacterium]
MNAHSPGKYESLRERIAQLSAEKREFLERLLSDSRLDVSRLPITPRKPDSDIIPLSLAQQRLWFLDQLDPNSSVYNVLNIISPQIRLHLPTLQLTLNEIIRRHEILRTSFAVTDGQPRQVIAPTLTPPLLVVDLQNMPQSQREAESLRLAASNLQRPFDLTRAPLLRVTLLQLDEREQLLLLTMHHIITDGWSIDVFRKELRLLYQAFSLGQPSPLPPLPIQYADFAIWQRQWLQKEELDILLAYWEKQLHGIPNLLELPTDRARPAVQTLRGATQTATFSLRLSDALKTLSRQEKVSLFMTLLAAFKILLYRYTGQADILVGTPVASRSRHEIEPLIGFFVNTLVLRTDLSGNPSFRELLGRVREVTLGAYANQDLPFEQLVNALQLRRDLSRTPLFQVMFEFQDVRTDNDDWALLSLNSLKVDGRTAKFDLTLKMLETEGGLLGTVEYNADLFESLTISRMLGHLRMLLKGIVADPGQPVSELLLLTADEQHQLLHQWNDTKTAYPRNVCIHQLFEAQVDRTSDAVAVVCGDQCLTYKALNEQANRLACYLRAQGVRPGMLVGICVERSLEMMVGVLGILKAGAAYLPLDPAYPKERLAFMLADSQAPMLLTQERLVDRLPQQVRVICLDRDCEAISRENSHNITTEVTERHLAYVIYTSGSTGKPKGVMIAHQAVLNTIHWLQDAFHLDADDVVAQKTAASFTDSVWEFFWTLIVGSKLAIIGDDIVKDPHLLYQCLRDEDITITQFVPPLMALFLDEVGSVEEAVPLPRLKWVFNGGEALPLQLAREWYSALSHARIGNIYGMTESAIYATQHIISEYPESNLSSVPIGRPIANAKVYILDKAGQLSPVGVSGEICIGGLSLAEGYLNRASLTAERLVPDAFSGQHGARLYKTGDLGRYLSDGTLQYLGRSDHQVKVRGFRVELGEIEAVLEQHPMIREAVVVVRRDETGFSVSSGNAGTTNRLIAYLVAEGSQPASTGELRPFLKEKLPDYMIPAAFVWLERLPLTTNGKVDRRSLPEPTPARPDLTTAFAAPTTPTEIILADIWAQVLGLDQVGIYDNFFELGGDSILTIQIVARANQAGLRMTPRQLFQEQTIAELSKVTSLEQTVELVAETVPMSIAQLRSELDWMSDEELQNVETIYPATGLQAGMLFHTVYGEVEGNYIAQLSWEMRGAVNVGALKEAWQRIVERHAILRTSFIWKREKEPFQVVYRQVRLPWEQYDWQGLSAEE